MSNCGIGKAVMVALRHVHKSYMSGEIQCSFALCVVNFYIPLERACSRPFSISLINHKACEITQQRAVSSADQPSPKTVHLHVKRWKISVIREMYGKKLFKS